MPRLSLSKFWRSIRPLRGLAPLLAISIGLGMPSPGAAKDGDGNVALVRSAFDAWAAGTGGPYELLAEGASWTITGNSLASKTYPSREAFMSEVIRPFNARMSSALKPVVRSIYQDRDTVIVFFDASGIARDGKPYTNTYAWFLEMRHGQIVKAYAFFDTLAFNDLWTRVHP